MAMDFVPPPAPKPVEIPGPLDQYSKVMALRNMMQQQQMGNVQLQQQQLQLQDQQRMRQVFSDPSIDWSKPDAVDSAATKLAQSGSPQLALQFKQHLIEQRKKLADLDETQLKSAQTRTDMAYKTLQGIVSAPQEQRPQLWAQTIDQYTKAGTIQAGQIPGQYPGDDQARAMLGTLGISHQMVQAEARERQAKTGEARLTAEQPGLEAKAQQSVAANAARQLAAATDQASYAKLRGSLPYDVAKQFPEQFDKDQVLQVGMTPHEQTQSLNPKADAMYRSLQAQVASGRPLSPEQQAFVKGYEKQKTLVPAATANIRLEGLQQTRGSWAYDSKNKTTSWVSADELNRARSEEPGRYTQPQYTPEAQGAKNATDYFTKGKGGQQLTAFNTAVTHLNTLDRLSADLNNTNLQIANRAKQAWAEQTGHPAPANFAAAVNAMSGEVAAALKASGATDQEIAHVGATFSRAQSPAQLKGAINTYRELLNGKKQQLQKQYEQAMQGKPAFGDGQSDAGEQKATHRFNPQTGKIEAVP